MGLRADGVEEFSISRLEGGGENSIFQRCAVEIRANDGSNLRLVAPRGFPPGSLPLLTSQEEKRDEGEKEIPKPPQILRPLWRGIAVEEYY